MEQCNAFCRLDKFGSNIMIKGLTPAQAIVLHVLHQANAGGNVFDLTNDGKADFGKISDAVVQVEPSKEQKLVIGAHVKKGKVVQAADVAKSIPEIREADEQIPETTETKVIPGKTRLRTEAEEMGRLRALYGGLSNKKGAKLLPLIFGSGMNVKLPQKFSELDFTKIAYDGLDVSLVLAGGDVSKA